MMKGGLLYCTLAFLVSSLLLLLASSAASQMSSSAFIRASCEARTPYPKLCYTSLSSHARGIPADPEVLARAALSVALENARSTSAAAAKMAHNHRSAPELRRTMRVCVGGLRHSVHRMKSSSREMIKSIPIIRNIHTWITAAVMDFDACNEGLTLIAMNSSTISQQITKGARQTLNALALIDGRPTCGAGRENIEFLRASCDIGNGFYPNLCYASLSRYACAIGTDAERLARKAIDILFDSEKSASAAMRKIAGRDADNKSTIMGVCVHLSTLSLQYISTALQYWEKLNQLKGPDLSYQIHEIESSLGGVGSDYSWCAYELYNADNEDKMMYHKVNIAVTQLIRKAEPFLNIALALLNDFTSQLCMVKC